MSIRWFTLTALALAGQGLAIPLCAQVSMRAFASTSLQVEADASPAHVLQTVPAGTELLDGFELRADAQGGTPPGSLRSSAVTTLGLTQGPDALVADIWQSATGGMHLFGGQAWGSFGEHDIELRLTSPVQVAVHLRIEACGAATDSTATMSGAAVLGTTPLLQVQNAGSPIYCFLGGHQQTLEVPLQLGPSPASLLLRGHGWGIGSSRGGNGSASIKWRVTLAPDADFPCRVAHYGSPCGASLVATSDLRYPGQHRLTLTDAGLPGAAWLAVGTRRTSSPFFGCELLTDTVFYMPWSIGSSGYATRLLTPPPIAGARATFQAATLAGSTVHTTGGIELVCR